MHYEHALGAVTIERVAGGAEETVQRRFSARTLRDAPDLYAAIQEMPPVEGHRAQPPLTRLFAIREQIRQRVPILVRRDLALENWQWIALLAAIALTAVVAHALVAVAHAGLEWLLASVGGNDTDGHAEAFRWPVRLVVTGVLRTVAFDWLGVVGQGFELVYRAVSVLAMRSPSAAMPCARRGWQPPSRQAPARSSA